jgi:hypothetical protein
MVVMKVAMGIPLPGEMVITRAFYPGIGKGEAHQSRESGDTSLSRHLSPSCFGSLTHLPTRLAPRSRSPGGHPGGGRWLPVLIDERI